MSIKLADIRAVLYALVDVVKTALADGKSVRLGELGTMRISVSSEGKLTADEVTSSAIIRSKNNFYSKCKIKRIDDYFKIRKSKIASSKKYTYNKHACWVKPTSVLSKFNTCVENLNKRVD